jgi:hypothetical protein
MDASAHGHVLRSRRLAGHRFKARRGRLAHLVSAYLDEMSKVVIGLVGHVLKRLGDAEGWFSRQPDRFDPPLRTSTEDGRGTKNRATNTSARGPHQAYSESLKNTPPYPGHGGTPEVGTRDIAYPKTKPHSEM